MLDQSPSPPDQRRSAKENPQCPSHEPARRNGLEAGPGRSKELLPQHAQPVEQQADGAQEGRPEHGGVEDAFGHDGAEEAAEPVVGAG